MARQVGLGPLRLGRSPAGLHMEVEQERAPCLLVLTMHASLFPRLHQVLRAASTHSISPLCLRQFPTLMGEMLQRRLKAWASVWAQEILDPLGASSSRLGWDPSSDTAARVALAGFSPSCACLCSVKCGLNCYCWLALRCAVPEMILQTTQRPLCPSLVNSNCAQIVRVVRKGIWPPVKSLVEDGEPRLQ